MRKLRTAKGKLTAYALYCGYVASKNGRDLMIEHNQYVIKAYGEENKYFNTITEARKHL